MIGFLSSHSNIKSSKKQPMFWGMRQKLQSGSCRFLRHRGKHKTSSQPKKGRYSLCGVPALLDIVFCVCGRFKPAVCSVTDMVTGACSLADATCPVPPGKAPFALPPNYLFHVSSCAEGWFLRGRPILLKPEDWLTDGRIAAHLVILRFGRQTVIEGEELGLI